ncbi:3-hydroxyacyl-CoA dehydrogenase family protein [Haematomicrobium sanguinis]|uniref:3-hydroxyacyl-CoA dehydrogenase family protein n=1 Tax=Haematomicrobium sanguinis TaxID=479106 RepID=UPI00047EDEF4|nr:3-hydroxyacyl-CoA dehydrogenase family protein [Haematomicrobium sanguinis]
MTHTLPENVAVIGGGRMGSGIAHAFLTGGSRVVVLEANDDALTAARTRVTEAVLASAERGKLSEDIDAVLARLSVELVSDAERALAGVSLVIEAVPEDFELKVSALRAAEAAAGQDAVLATNTSSLSVTDLSDALAHPGRLLGLHFFNPVPASKLVEIVVGERTPPELVEDARGWVAALGKQPIVVKDSPGFASSRLGVALAIEAMRMVEEGVASAEDIDLAMELGYKHPVGPLKTTDIVGLDVRLGIAEYLAETLGPHFTPPQILREKVERGELGQKSGQGFYTW